MKSPSLIFRWPLLLTGRRLTADSPSTPARVRSRRRRAVVSLAVGAFAYVVLTVSLGVAAQFSTKLRDPVFGDKEERLAKCEASAPDSTRVMMLGTSRTGYAFNARRAEAQLNTALGRPVTVFNFGIAASGPVTHKLYLDRLLAAGHRPDLLVLEILPSSLAKLDEGPYERLFITGDRMDHSEVQKAIGYGFPAEALQKKWRLAAVHPWFTLRFQMLGRMSSGWLPWQLRFDAGRTSDDHGWMMPLGATDTPERKQAAFDRAWMEYHVLLAGMTPGGGAGRALEDLLALARQNNIAVKVVILPESPKFRQMYHPDVLARLNTFLKETCSRHGVDWIDARDWLPEEAFYDGHHTMRTGAEAFTDRLTRDVIVPHLGLVKSTTK